MAIVPYKRPSDRNWSGNPIPYHLYSAAAEADPTIYFEIKVFFKRTDAAAYSEILIFPWNPYKGVARMDLSEVLESLLAFEVPAIPSIDEYNSPTLSQKATGLFYIGWREITPGVDAPDFTTTESVNERFVIKGGIAYHKWRADNYWINYFDVVKPFLTWQQSGRLAGLSERMYVSFLNLTDIDAADIIVRRTVVFTDGSTYSQDYGFPVAKYNIGYFPAGAIQLKLDQVNAAKKIYYWDLEVRNSADDVAMSTSFRYFLDNRNDYNGITLNYRNSTGGWDSARIRGVIEYDQKREFTEVGQIAAFDYFSGRILSSRVRAANSTELLVYKGDVGHLGKEEQGRLRDIHFQREVAWEIGKKWIPIMTMTGDSKLKDSESRRWTTPIEFSIASGGDRYYTPDSIDLGNGDFPAILICNAVISDPEAFGLSISWNLVSGFPIKYFISTPAVSGGAPHETTNTNYTFDWLPVGDNVITVQPVCKIGDEYVLGTPHFVTISVGSTCTPVAIPGGQSLPDGSLGVAYDEVINITGTPPFALSNVTKPGWMIIALEEISPGNWAVRHTGTPTSDFVGYEKEVSYTITNCAGSFVEFDDSINVGPGAIHVTNTDAGWSITNVTPAFYAITSGAFPIGGGQTLNGSHTGYVGAISVNVTYTSGPGRHLYLYHNGALITSILITASGVFTFGARTYITGDVIQITLAP